MAPASFADQYHADPCRRCEGIFTRNLMTPARTILGQPGARGWYCAACSQIMRAWSRR